VAAEEQPGTLMFVTLDAQQGKAAEREGFTVLGAALSTTPRRVSLSAG
jgi:hypothetical protein